ncbi:hypothetical protein GCM10010232_12990 [Streptomyces amakusaensis]
MEMQTWRDSRAKATDASEAIRAALAALGVPESAWSGIRPTVTYNGDAYVHLGILPAHAVEQITEALRLPSSPRPRPPRNQSPTVKREGISP